jgi:hypothetical protein
MCGGKTRLFGIESHPLIGQLRVLSSVCPDCNAVRVDMAPPSESAEPTLGFTVNSKEGSYADGQASH